MKETSGKYAARACLSPHPDKFEIEILDQSVRVTRKDRDMGWGQDLTIVVTDTSRSMDRLIRVGWSGDASKVIPVNLDGLFSEPLHESGSSLIEALKVYKTPDPKIRIGVERDGGYLINEALLRKSSRLISIGIDGEDSFERHWIDLKPHDVVECYDGSCHCGRVCSENFDLVGRSLFYTKINVGTQRDQMHLGSIVSGKSDFLLKIDIEGGEYSLFDNVDLSGALGVVMEVHDLQARENRRKIVEILSRNLSDFFVFHIHGNVYGGHFPLERKNSIVERFPKVLEISMARRGACECLGLDRSSFPLAGLDFSNHPKSEDLPLDWINST